MARCIAHVQGERLISIAEAMDRQTFVYELGEKEIVGFVFPVYAWSPSKIVMDFVAKLELKLFLNPYLFAVATCGEEAGAAMDLFKAGLRKKLWRLNSSAAVVMPNNYIPMYDVDPEAVQKDKLNRAEQSLRRINEGISLRKEGILCDARGRIPAIKSRIAGPLFRTFGCSARHFWVTDQCISCGLCRQVCPVLNITIKDNKPIWGKRCLQCLACIHRCPVKAIQYGKSTLEKGRYCHPDGFDDH